MQHCKALIARPGYSTLMDAFALGARCIFIPTPGQTEQEYLGERLKANGQAVVVNQNALVVATALAAAERLQPPNHAKEYAAREPLLQNALSEAFAMVRQKRQR
jgi:UDP-N-acetylglucosamine:LPS N-acetylglucosamine transferase